MRRASSSFIAALPPLFLAGVLLSAAAGALDPTFDGDGRLTTDLGGNEGAHALAIQPDGKIVVAGFRSVLGVSDILLARYSSDGFLDGDFGFLGTVVSNFGGDESAAALAIQPNDGKIVVGGSNGSGNFFLVRYHSNGTLDFGFGGTGYIVTDFGGFDHLAAIAIQPADGKIVAAGTSDSRFVLARYDTNGALEFSTLTNVGGAQQQAHALAIQTDGKIVVAGMNLSSSGNTDFALVRYNANGALDLTFGTLGKVLTDFGGGFEEAFAVAIDGNGAIVAAGTNGLGDFALARYDANGSLDQAFGAGGLVLTDVGGNDRAFAVAVQENGAIIAAGESDPGGSRPDFALTRYASNGMLDSGFGAGGIVLTDFTVPGSPGEDFAFSTARALAIQTDGKIVAAGRAWTGVGETTDVALARYLADANTPAGTNVAVQLGAISVTFQTVTQAGETSQTTSSTGPQPPAGFSLGNPPTYYDITTTAVFTGAIEVCINYTGIAYTDETSLQLMHYEGTAFVNVTTFLDPVNDVICGSVTSLSPFVVVEPSFVAAIVDVNPGTLNTQAQGPYLTVYIEFAGGTANPADIDVSSVILSIDGNTTAVAAGAASVIGDGNGNGRVDLMVKFDRATVQSWLTTSGTATVRVSGQFASGGAFQGEDTVQVIVIAEGTR